MKLHRMLVRLGVLCAALLFLTTQTQAKVEPNVSSGREGNGVMLMNHDELMRFAKSSGLKLQIVKIVRISKNDLRKLARLPANGCGCAAPVEDEGGDGANCFVGCMARWGVPQTSTWACIATCTASLPACAACLGITETIVAGCALYCVWKPLLSDNRQASPLKHNLRQAPNANSQQAKLSPRREGRVSMR